MSRRRNRNRLKADEHDNREELEEKNKKLRNRIKVLEKNNRELKSQVSTLTQTWNKTEDFLREVTDGVPLKDILKNVEDEVPLKKAQDRCPVCNTKGLKRIQFDGFHVLVCNNDKCEYRNKVNEIEQSD